MLSKKDTENSSMNSVKIGPEVYELIKMYEKHYGKHQEEKEKKVANTDAQVKEIILSENKSKEQISKEMNDSKSHLFHLYIVSIIKIV